MRRLGSLVTVLCLAVALAGCSDETDEPEADTTSSSAASPEAAGDEECAALLQGEALAELVGDDAEPGVVVPVSGLDTCQWGSPLRVQVIDIPAEDWLVQLPALVDQLRITGVELSPDQERRLDAGLALAEDAGAADADEACEVFSTMIEIQGVEPGSDRILNLVPTRQRPQGVTGQACLDGRFVSVLFVDPAVPEDQRGSIDAVEAALDDVIAAD